MFFLIPTLISAFFGYLAFGAGSFEPAAGEVLMDTAKLFGVLAAGIFIVERISA